ncbi:MAG TPA: hypothetical protein VMV18_02425 [bacterium]|nr:hypothetical protein [bacterium]
MKTIALAFFVTLFAAGDATPQFPVAMVFHGCGPTDGATIRLTLAKSGNACGPQATNTLTLIVDGSAPKTGTTYDVKAMNATRCSKPGKCDAAAKASLRFDEFTDGTSAKGHWTASLKDGTAIEGDFDAVFCEKSPPPCG